MGAAAVIGDDIQMLIVQVRQCLEMEDRDRLAAVLDRLDVLARDVSALEGAATVSLPPPPRNVTRISDWRRGR